MRERPEEVALLVENADGRFAGEQGVELVLVGGVSERGERDIAIECDGGQTLTLEVVGRDASEVTAAEREETVAERVVSESGGRGIEGVERKGADEFAEAVELDDGGFGGVGGEHVTVARANGEIAAPRIREGGDGELAFDGAGRAVHDADEVTGGQSQEKMIGERIVGEADEAFTHGEKTRDRGPRAIAAGIVDFCGRIR